MVLLPCQISYCLPHERLIRVRMLGQGIMTLFGKPESQKDGGLLLHKNHLTLRIQISFIFKGEGIWLVFKFLSDWIFCSCSCQHRSGHNIPVSLQQDKCSAFVLPFFPLYSAIFRLISVKWVIPLKVKPEGQNRENGLSNAFQAI